MRMEANPVPNFRDVRVFTQGSKAVLCGLLGSLGLDFVCFARGRFLERPEAGEIRGGCLLPEASTSIDKGLRLAGLKDLQNGSSASL